MRKIFILCTAFLLVSSFAIPSIHTNAETTMNLFNDVGTTHRAQQEINYLAMGKIVTGGIDGNFNPERNVTRAEAAAMIGRALDLDGTNRVTRFNDVGISQFASGYIQSAVDKNIISGYEGGVFKPDQFVTRGEMAILINRAFKYGAATIATSADALMKKGIAQGIGDGSFGFDLHIKRSDFSVFLARAINPELRVNYETKVVGQASVTADSLNLRKGPIANYDIMDSLEQGTNVDIIERIGNWAYVKANGNTGFVNSGYLAGSDTPPSTDPDPGSSPDPTQSNQLDQFVKSQTIVIDPGHGGSDPGAVNKELGLHESDLTLAVGLKVQSIFKGTGFKLAMTRETDVYPTLGDRTAFAKQVDGDVFLSIHANSGTSSASGTETYYYSASSTNPYVADSKLLATYIQKRMVDAWGLADRKVKIGDLYVLRQNIMPAALLELGFITNSGDAYKLNTSAWQQKAATAVYLGILDYYQAKTGLDFTPLYNRVK